MGAQFRPCIDLHNGRVKQIVGGSLNDAGTGLQTNFVSELSPAYYARLYRDHHLAGGHVIMLGPGNQAAAREALQAWPGHLQVGGGITAANAGQWLDAGADRVIVTSYIFSDGELNEHHLKELAATTGSRHLVLDLSCRRKGDQYFVVTDRWQKFSSLTINRANLEYLAGYAEEFLIHAVDVEGRQAGIDAELLERLARCAPVPCVYAGGISSMEDIARIEHFGAGKIHYTIGSALDIFGGHLSFETVATCSNNTPRPDQRSHEFDQQPQY